MWGTASDRGDVRRRRVQVAWAFPSSPRSRTSGCSGAGANRRSLDIQHFSARPLNLSVRPLAMRATQTMTQRFGRRKIVWKLLTFRLLVGGSVTGYVPFSILASQPEQTQLPL